MNSLHRLAFQGIYNSSKIFYLKSPFDMEALIVHQLSGVTLQHYGGNCLVILQICFIYPIAHTII